MDDIFDIPSHFLCPISLQLMADPVTVSSGITYNRDSIEKWLFKFKKATCPVTKQPLSNAHLIPNNTLRCLIRDWCAASEGVSGLTTTPKQPAERNGKAEMVNEDGNSPHALLSRLKSLRTILLEGEVNGDYFLAASGMFRFLISMVRDTNDEAREEALIVLYHVKVHESSCFKDMIDDEIKGDELVDALMHAVKHGKFRARVFAMMLLNSVYEIANPNNLHSLRPEIFSEIVKVVGDKTSHQASKSALKLLLRICPHGRNRIKAVEAGAVHAIIELLLDEFGDERRASELLLTVLDQLCGCAEGRAELLAHSAGLAAVGKKILRVSNAASERAVRVVAAVCRFSATGRVLREMVEVGVVEKLCLVVQMEAGNGVVKMKERAKEILRLHSRVWRGCNCTPPHLLSFFQSS